MILQTVFISLATGTIAPLSAVEPVSATAVPAHRVTIADSFWGPRQAANRKGTLAANFEQCEKTGRIENFAKAGRKEGKYEGLFFNDSDVYKMIEGACLVLERTRDKKLDAQIDELIALIAGAQQPDGYLNAYFTLTDSTKQWTDLPTMHEMYCAGHLIEAGVTHHRVTGKRSLLDVAVRFADLIDSRYGPPPKINGVCGHEEIELALLKLWRHTGETRYRDLAAYFLAQRGRTDHVGAPAGTGDTRVLYGEYCQDQAPLESHQHVVGHAVRAMYLYCAAADLAAMAGDSRYTEALDRAWNDLTTKKMYITAGIGNSAANEGFTTSYDLPNDSAYAETCAGIGLAMWGHRMALLHGERGARYMDVVERGLYNGILSGVSLDGSKFYYVNPLGSRGKHHRQEWFSCACCPPNILRFIEQIGGMIYAHTPGALIVNLPIGSRAQIGIPQADGGTVDATVEQRTGYPWTGETRLVFSLPSPAAFDVKLRVPGWCRNVEFRVNDQVVDAHPEDGYSTITRTWKDGDTIAWTMEMPIERMKSHPSIAGNVGRVAFQRGPVVYCFEGADNPGINVRQAAIPAGAAVRAEQAAGALDGMTVLRAEALAPSDEPMALYARASAKAVTMTAIPYFAWNNRAPGEMLVWMPESLALAERPVDASVSPSASYCFHTDTITALHDMIEPSGSSDHAVPRMTFWPRKGTTEWVQYDLAAPRKISGVEVYWFDDTTKGGGCALPESWRVLAKQGGEWKEVASGAACPVTRDTYCVARFEPVMTNGVRLEVQLPKAEGGASSGLLEWKLVSE